MHCSVLFKGDAAGIFEMGMRTLRELLLKDSNSRSFTGSYRRMRAIRRSNYTIHSIISTRGYAPVSMKEEPGG